ncbi:hypothetical protein O9X90_01250 [Agrobacterium leguminum]|uniref:hypothetical protein n=1 Tax=Agrobacterium leguminum TaxID=2792015 RepID=UPI0022B84A25|nr:hypothetical protein [Agrobacterium leguminum]MCZ7930925.1 hypothetical protein [Agrobacterium leguminum]
MVRNAIITTIGAVIVSAITYYFFTPFPADPSRQVEIEYQDMRVTRDVLVDSIRIALNSTNQLSKDIVENFHKKFDYYRELTVASYVVSNAGSDVVNGLELHLSDYAMGYFKQGDAWEKLPDNSQVKTFEILPGKEVRVLLVTTPRLLGATETFVSKGRKIPIRELIPEYDVPLSRFSQDYPFVVFMLAAIGGIVILLMMTALALTLYYKDDPTTQANNVDSSDLATKLALINWLRIENPEKFERVVKHAERMHAKWLKASARPADNQ